jgi:hypothetical protein
MLVFQRRGVLKNLSALFLLFPRGFDYVPDLIPEAYIFLFSNSLISLWGVIYCTQIPFVIFRNPSGLKKVSLLPLGFSFGTLAFTSA